MSVGETGGGLTPEFAALNEATLDASFELNPVITFFSRACASALWDSIYKNFACTGELF